jgi:hypothetical protein
MSIAAIPPFSLFGKGNARRELELGEPSLIRTAPQSDKVSCAEKDSTMI